MIQISQTQIDFFEKNGFLQVDNLINNQEVMEYKAIYEDFLSNKIDAKKYRGDLSGQNNETELITQIMVPSRVYPLLLEMPIHLKTLDIAKQLMGTDIELDFDMLIDKAPHTNAPTPWHQDCAYWINMPDKRAASCWLALDDAYVDNGCMWYVPGSHLLPMRSHRPSIKGGGALQCDVDEKEGVAIELKAGSCVFHHGGTLHYSRGNSTDDRRRAFITNYRPQAMIEFERQEGYDHTGERKVRSK